MKCAKYFVNNALECKNFWQSFWPLPPRKMLQKNPLSKFFPLLRKISLFRPQILPLLCKNLAIRGPFSTVPALGLAKIPLISTPGALEPSRKLLLGCSFSNSANLSTFILFCIKVRLLLFVFPL